METETKTVAVQQALTVPDGFTIGRMRNGKVFAQDVFTAAELQEIVQQAHDRYGVVADPFATPGSADDVVQFAHGIEPLEDYESALRVAHNIGVRA